MEDKERYLNLARLYYQALRVAAIICLKINSPDIALEDDDYEAMDELYNFVEQIDTSFLEM